MNLLSWLLPKSVSEAEIRSEVWRLGARHRGWPLEGALDELNNPHLAPARAQLLRACVRRLRTA